MANFAYEVGEQVRVRQSSMTPYKGRAGIIHERADSVVGIVYRVETEDVAKYCWFDECEIEPLLYATLEQIKTDYDI